MIGAHARITSLVGLLLLLAVAFGSFIRINGALTADNFDTDNPVGLLRSDPALTCYLLERVIAADGLLPDDAHADPRLEHPDHVDLAATFTMGQEFLIAQLYRLVGDRIPLHVFCVWVMGIFASLSVLAVFALALELSGRVVPALLVAVFYLLLPANYRSMGFILMREDFSLPFLALHLWLFARATRIQAAASYLLSAVPLLLALATWHAMRFIVAVELGCFLFTYLMRASRGLPKGPLWLLPLCVGLLSLAVPTDPPCLPLVGKSYR